MSRRSRCWSGFALVLVLGCASAATEPAGHPRAGWPVMDLSATDRPALVAALSELIAPLAPDAAAVCLGLRPNGGGPPHAPDAGLLEALGAIRPVVSLEACPRTYASMVAPVDRDGNVIRRPEGYVDPFHVEVVEHQREGPGRARFDVRVGQGTLTRAYRCRVARDEGPWRGTCALTGTWIS